MYLAPQNDTLAREPVLVGRAQENHLSTVSIILPFMSHKWLLFVAKTAARPMGAPGETDARIKIAMTQAHNDWYAPKSDMPVDAPAKFIFVQSKAARSWRKLGHVMAARFSMSDNFSDSR
jgi:hypothetical protein